MTGRVTQALFGSTAAKWRSIAVAAIVVVIVVTIGYQAVRPRFGRAPAPAVAADVQVLGGPVGTSYTIRRAAGPAPTIPGAQPLGDAEEIVPVGGDGVGATVQFHFDHGRLPAGTPACDTATTGIDVGIAVYDTDVEAWLPLPTTCQNDVLRATAPHFSWYQTYIVMPGQHTVSAIIHGAIQAVSVVTTTTTSVYQYTRDLLTQVWDKFQRNLTATFPADEFVCRPSSTNWSASVEPRRADRRTDACVVRSGSTDQAHFKNGFAYPISFALTGAAGRYLNPAGDADPDPLVGLEKIMATASGRTLVPGLTQGVVNIAVGAPTPIVVSGQLDEIAYRMDLDIALLSVMSIRFKAAEPEVRVILQRVDQVIVERLGSGGYRVTIASIRTTIIDVVRENPNWAARTNAILHLLDAVTCGSGIASASIAANALHCLAAFAPDSTQLNELLIDLAAQIKALPEAVQGGELYGYPWRLLLVDTRVTMTITLRCLTPSQFAGVVLAGRSDLSRLDVADLTCFGNHAAAIVTPYNGSQPGQFALAVLVRTSTGWAVQELGNAFDPTDPLCANNELPPRFQGYCSGG